MPEKDIRPKTTSIIWGIATAMMALSIPLSDITHSAGIPGLVIVAATISTIAVWAFGGNKGPTTSEITSQKQIQELEQRLANLESITNFEHKLLDAKYAAEPISVAAPTAVSTPRPSSSRPVSY
jgi:hypothetical protein